MVQGELMGVLRARVATPRKVLRCLCVLDGFEVRTERVSGLGVM